MKICHTKYRSLQPYLINYKLGPLWTLQTIKIISGKWFSRRFFIRIGQQLHNFHNSMKNNGPPREQKYKANPCSGLRDEVKKVKSSRRQQ